MASARPTLTQPSTSTRHYAGSYEKHAHDHAQVLVGLDGNLQLELDGRAAFVDPTCALIVPAGVAHEYLAETRATVFVIDCPAGRGVDRVRRFVPPASWAGRAPALDDEQFAAVLGAAATLLPRRRLSLDTLNARIDHALHHRWTTAELAALCCLSPQRFHERFLELTGVAPMAHVRARRLAAAAALLQGGLTLEAAAARVGYAGASALAYALKRDRGIGARAARTAR